MALPSAAIKIALQLAAPSRLAPPPQLRVLRDSNHGTALWFLPDTASVTTTTTTCGLGRPGQTKSLS